MDGNVMCLMNCSWRGYSGGIIGCIHFTEHSTATTSPTTSHLVEAAAHLKTSIKVRGKENFLLKHKMDRTKFIHLYYMEENN